MQKNLNKMGRHYYGWAKNSNMKNRTKFDKKIELKYLNNTQNTKTA